MWIYFITNAKSNFSTMPRSLLDYSYLFFIILILYARSIYNFIFLKTDFKVSIRIDFSMFEAFLYLFHSTYNDILICRGNLGGNNMKGNMKVRSVVSCVDFEVSLLRIVSLALGDTLGDPILKAASLFLLLISATFSFSLSPFCCRFFSSLFSPATPDAAEVETTLRTRQNSQKQSQK